MHGRLGRACTIQCMVTGEDACATGPGKAPGSAAGGAPDPEGVKGNCRGGGERESGWGGAMMSSGIRARQGAIFFSPGREPGDSVPSRL